MDASKDQSSAKRIYLSPPHMGESELELLSEAFRSNWIAPLGPHVDAFESEFAQKLGMPHAVALSSGTAALHLALLTVGVKPGDEVVTSTLTFVATVNAIRYCGATPIFIDSEKESWNLDPNLLADELHAAAQLGRLPAAVVVIDVFGQCANYARISEICRRYEIPLIEDAAEALGATFQGSPAGTFGDIGCFSFNGSKIITTSGGGMLVTNNPRWASHVRYLSTQARLDVPHYEHADVGYNYRLSNLLAAVGRGQLRVLDDRVACRRRNFEMYNKRLGALPGLGFMPEIADGYSTRWLTCLEIDHAEFGATNDAIRLALGAQNIEARPVWKPMHLQPVNSGCRVRDRQVSERLFERGLCLPSGSNLTADELDRVANIVAHQAKPTRARRAS